MVDLPNTGVPAKFCCTCHALKTPRLLTPKAEIPLGDRGGDGRGDLAGPQRVCIPPAHRARGVLHNSFRSNANDITDSSRHQRGTPLTASAYCRLGVSNRGIGFFFSPSRCSVFCLNTWVHAVPGPAAATEAKLTRPVRGAEFPTRFLAGGTSSSYSSNPMNPLYFAGQCRI